MHIRPNLLQQSIQTAISFIYPSQCKVCEEYLSLNAKPYICLSCWKDIEYINPPWCEICGVPSDVNLCDSCASRPPRYGKLRTITVYEKTIQHAIHLFKFEKRTSLRHSLVRLLLDNIPNDLNLQDYDYVLPIPIHKKRLRERGFNQSLLLAEGLEKATGLKVLKDALVRGKNTSPQSSLHKEARQTNILGAFELKNPDYIRSKQILVLDDVYTTGATVGEVVKILWDADPVDIDVLTLARTLHSY